MNKQTNKQTDSSVEESWHKNLFGATTHINKHINKYTTVKVHYLPLCVVAPNQYLATLLFAGKTKIIC